MNSSIIFVAGLLITGFVAGYFSGLIGIGGGVIIVPALVLFFGFSQQSAQGTTLALLVPPIGFLAAYHYYTNGFSDIRAAFILCLGFIFGSYLGAGTAVRLQEDKMRMIFGAVLVILGIRMFFLKQGG